MPPMLASSVSGSIATLNAVSTRRLWLSRCERTDSFEILERVGHFLVVLEHVPDPFGGIGDVVEVDVEVVGEVPLLGALEVPKDGAHWPHDPTEVDDLLLDLRQVAHDLGGSTLEDVVLELVQLGAHLAQHRERGIDAGVDDPVQQVPGPLREHRVADLLALAVTFEHGRQWGQWLVRQRDQVVRTHEQVNLRGEETTAGLVEDREVENDEQVVVVGIQLWPLVARGDILDRQRVEAELALQPLTVRLARALQVQPADAGRGDDIRPGCLSRCGGRSRGRAGRPPDATQRPERQVRHLEVLPFPSADRSARGAL